MPTMNLPISLASYVRERPALKNRQQRRARVVRQDFTSSTPSPSELPELPVFTTATAVDEGVDTAVLQTGDSSLTQAVLLDWMGQQPIAFHRIYVDISGSVTAAVWLSMVLSHMASGLSQIDAQRIYRFTLGRTQCEAETGLTDAEQRKAHRLLVKAGILFVRYPNKSEAHSATTHTPSFQLDLRKLTALLLTRSEGLADMLRASATLAPALDVPALERNALERAARRRA
ncbi:hypothetical protein [Hydrogenophaga crassostreae]|jgi:hypothetical protein|uniref:hypothetical protein n=1 Tax=Hydrogenophaga crassostreae TaxID=1763535 RepID=UPI000A40146D|nr:hypothetical protein [Hydrogenophaga crassostreae]